MRKYPYIFSIIGGIYYKENAKAPQMRNIQHVSRSGEKGRTASFWLVGESRLLYVRTKGKYC